MSSSHQNSAASGVALVAPGAVSTELPEPEVIVERKRKMLARQVIKRLGTPRGIVGLIVFLYSDEANYIAGQIFSVDGGDVMH